MYLPEHEPEHLNTQGSQRILPVEFHVVKELVTTLFEPIMQQAPRDIQIDLPPASDLLFRPLIVDLFGLPNLRRIYNGMAGNENEIKGVSPDGWTYEAERSNQTLTMQIVKERSFCSTTYSYRHKTETVDRRTSTREQEYRAHLVLPLERPYHHIALARKRKDPNNVMKSWGMTVDARCEANTSEKKDVFVKTKNRFDGGIVLTW